MLVMLLLRGYPGSRLCGHRDLSPDFNHNGEREPEGWIKVCPCFGAVSFCKIRCLRFGFRQHHNSKCRDFTLGIDLEGCFMDYSDCYGWNYHNDTSFESIEQAQIADYYKAASFKPENQD